MALLSSTLTREGISTLTVPQVCAVSSASSASSRALYFCFAAKRAGLNADFDVFVGSLLFRRERRSSEVLILDSLSRPLPQSSKSSFDLVREGLAGASSPYILRLLLRAPPLPLPLLLLLREFEYDRCISRHSSTSSRASSFSALDAVIESDSSTSEIILCRWFIISSFLTLRPSSSEPPDAFNARRTANPTWIASSTSIPESSRGDDGDRFFFLPPSPSSLVLVPTNDSRRFGGDG
mmetsp:Transcript_22635/g.53554  ORF Transcript_22635/g.53554 Transcript_22635/m.53554 type:complete len:237 (+) Transcript_22635:1692-2402(+)